MKFSDELGGLKSGGLFCFSKIFFVFSPMHLLVSLFRDMCEEAYNHCAQCNNKRFLKL